MKKVSDWMIFEYSKVSLFSPLFLEAWAEILKNNCWFFGQNKDAKRSFWNWLTFTHISKDFWAGSSFLKSKQIERTYKYLKFTKSKLELTLVALIEALLNYSVQSTGCPPLVRSPLVRIPLVGIFKKPSWNSTFTVFHQSPPHLYDELN